jgi:hypothetical protein
MNNKTQKSNEKVQMLNLICIIYISLTYTP